jgi:two-component system osmolarity sensor histidine kinase EnvZ
MVADIAQVDAIIDKFLDYARPDHVKLLPVPLADWCRACIPSYGDHDMHVQIESAPGTTCCVLADEVELVARAFQPAGERAPLRQSTDTGIARVRIAATARDKWVLRVRDHGVGVSPELLPNLTRPFFRGDTARTSATGAGLGLAIVAKMVHNMGGAFSLTNARSGGLSANIRLPRVTSV